MSLRLIAPLVLLLPSAAYAAGGHDHKHDHGHEEHREHAAHVHGEARLTLAQEGAEIHLELDSPSANIVGFEHMPETHKQHEKVEKAEKTLKGGDSLFRFNKEAACVMKSAKIESPLLEGDHHKHEEHGHKEHGKHDDHGHDEHGHKEHKEHGHEKHDDHDHGKSEHADEETHSEFEASYVFACKNAGELKTVGVGLFKAFSGMEEVRVEYVTDRGQGVQELTAAKSTLKLR